MFLADFLRASDIQKRIGVVVKLEDLALGHAIAFAIGIVAAESPAIPETVLLEHRRHRFQITGDIR